MNQYLIEHKIKTPAKISGDLSFSSVQQLSNPDDEVKAEIELDDIIFKQWSCTPEKLSTGGAWITQVDVDAEDYKEAHINFLEKLRNIIPRMCFVGQCFMNFEYESYLVKRKNNNPDNSFFLYRIKDRENNPGLSFSEKQIGATKELKNYPYRQVFRFLQECINTPNYYARLALLLAALEAMSGEVEKMSCDCPKGKCYKTYDKDKMKEILGDDNLFNDLFGPEGLRHKLLHGHLIDFELSKDYFSKIYKAIVRYFNKSYFLEIYEEMEGAKQYAKHLPRSFFGNKELLELWLRTTGEINLKNVLNIFSKDTYWIGHKEGDFEVIKEPPNY